jgi:hypothetical protein
MELNFDDILSGKEANPTVNVAEQIKLKPSDVKQRQQSCMIHDIDKDLVSINLYSYLQILNRLPKISESAYLICCAS